MPINWNRRKYTEEEFKLAWLESENIAQCARKLNLTIYGSTYATLKDTAEELSLTRDHMIGQGWNVGSRYRKVLEPKPLSYYLVNDRSVSSSFLKSRLIKEGILEYKCAKCDIFSWLGEKLSLQLDHINGDRKDNRIENLRLLCPNCHSQTDTFCRGLKSKSR